jgi:CheY-like chemotaxis protein
MATVLIVDDDAALRESIAETLADLGHDPIEAVDGRAALARLRQPGVDAVLLDLRMPGLDGMEVLRQLRAQPEAPPVAVLTAVPTAGNTIEAMRASVLSIILPNRSDAPSSRRCWPGCCRVQHRSTNRQRRAAPKNQSVRARRCARCRRPSGCSPIPTQRC